jgi:hypothetical protein
LLLLSIEFYKLESFLHLIHCLIVTRQVDSRPLLAPLIGHQAASRKEERRHLIGAERLFFIFLALRGQQNLFILKLKFEQDSQKNIQAPLSFNIFVTNPFKVAVDQLLCVHLNYGVPVLPTERAGFSCLLLQVSLSISRRSFTHYFSFITNCNIAFRDDV